MTQEEKQLLWKDICARLPFGLIVEETLQNENGDIVKRIVPAIDCGFYFIHDHLDKVKPYLRPMSSMTEKESFKLGRETVDESIFQQAANEIDWLNKYKFDWRGLIPKGLALEAKEGMYK